LDREALELAARRWGVELSYTDVWGQTHLASDETLLGILAALGVPCETPEAIAQAMAGQDAAEWSHPLGLTQVVCEDAQHLPLRVPEQDAGGSVKLEIAWENGDLQHHPYWLPELKETGRAEFAGRRYVEKRLPLPRLRPGYHRARVYRVREPELTVLGEAPLIVCPPRAREFEGRAAGVALALYGLRSARNWGCGDFTDLRAAIDAFAPAGAAFLALNPLHAIANREPYNISPYLPECSLYRNWLYLDVERVPGFASRDAPQAEIAELRRTAFVAYDRVAAAKLKALRPAFQRFGTSPEFEAYIEREGECLHDYAVYRALWSRLHTANPQRWLWTDWPEAYRDPRSPEVARFAREHERDVLFWKFLQWQVDAQLADAQAHALARGMKIGLYHDLALATDRFGADLWAHREFYAVGARTGAPPDLLAPGGQDWGFPPPRRDAHRAAGYRLFAQTIRNTARNGGALRIDHVMRFFRLFWIPDGLTARDGAYVRDYTDDLLGILALESRRGGFIMIGEDLGTVEPEVRARLSGMGVLGYRVLWFEKDAEGRYLPPEAYPEQAAVTTTTHDLATLAGFRLGRDIEARRAAGLIGDAAYREQWDARRADLQALEEACAAAGFPGDPLGFVLATPCSLAIVNQEDLTGETEQTNLPATTWEHPNWRRKMRVAVEELGPVAAELGQRLRAAGRA
jgi:4-alpha-glucanotransferase